MKAQCLLEPFSDGFRRLRQWFLRRGVNKAIRTINALDDKMVDAGWRRTERRQFWREFTKRQEIRTSTFKGIL